VPNEIPITGLNGWLGGVVAPDSIRWFLQFLIFEPVAQYDMCGGAWGFVGVWALVMAVWVVLFRREWITLPRINLIWAFYLALLLSFLLTPGRVTARYAILSGFLVIFPILVLWINDRLPRWSSRLLFLAIALQIPYITIERVLFRGVQASEIARAPQVIAENFRDILVHGEPQSPERWMHFDYVPSLRKNEPRDVVVGQDCVSLTALYWGRTFSNHVTVAPECCRWPYDCSQVGGGSPL
jgi:hypothetical protein